jgi:polyisoprenoid-binding protein YceI
MMRRVQNILARVAMLAGGAGLWGSAWALPERYELDPEHTFVHLEVLHFSTSTIRARLGPVQGSVMLDRADRKGSLALRIATRSVSTGVGVFDARLREADLLACDDWPEAFFVAERFRFEGDTPVEVRGEFTFRGVSRPLSLHARHFACRAPAGGGAEVCGGDFVADVERSEFGATFGLPWVADRVRIVVQVRGQRR